MSSYSWVKLYHEVLHDPKMGRLTDNLWRRVIEVILLAGETGRDGLLPGALDMAWTLRLSVEALEADLLALAKYDIVEQTPQGWKVVHFENRQAAIDAKDRVSAYRNRIQKHDYYATETTEKQESNEPVTNRNTDKNKNREDKKKIGAEKAPRPRDLLFDAIAEVTHTDPATAGPSIAKVKVTLEKATPPYTPDEVFKFGSSWPEWKDKPPTLWQLKEQIGAVRQNGNGQHADDDRSSIAGYKVIQ